VIQLPIDKESRIKILSEHCAKIESLMQIVIANPVLIEYKDIEQLANERRICFLVEAPTFVMTYTDNGQVLTKNCIVETFRYDSNFSKMVQNRYQNGEVFVFYQLNKSMNTIRGAFMKSDIISKERDSRIDELLS
jgi:hypothetical protein